MQDFDDFIDKLHDDTKPYQFQRRLEALDFAKVRLMYRDNIHEDGIEFATKIVRLLNCTEIEFRREAKASGFLKKK